MIELRPGRYKNEELGYRENHYKEKEKKQKRTKKEYIENINALILLYIINNEKDKGVLSTDIQKNFKSLVSGQSIKHHLEDLSGIKTKRNKKKQVYTILEREILEPKHKKNREGQRTSKHNRPFWSRTKTTKQAFSDAFKICYNGECEHAFMFTDYFNKYGHKYIPKFLKEIGLHLKKSPVFNLDWNDQNMLDFQYREGHITKKEYLAFNKQETKSAKSIAVDSIEAISIHTPSLFRIIISGSKEEKDRLRFIINILKEEYKFNDNEILETLHTYFSIVDFSINNSISKEEMREVIKHTKMGGK